MNTTYKKNKGGHGEEIVSTHYQQQGYTLLSRNYTIAWGELDLIFSKDNALYFVEVKVVDHIDDLHNYITPKKLQAVSHTIDHYLHTHPTTMNYVLDIVFVRDNSILEIYQNITNT